MRNRDFLWDFCSCIEKFRVYISLSSWWSPGHSQSPGFKRGWKREYLVFFIFYGEIKFLPHKLEDPKVWKGCTCH